MALTFFILSHRSPDQVERLIGRLLSREAATRVLLHHDPTGPSLDRDWPKTKPALELLEPRPVAWGGASLVDVVLDGFAQLAPTLADDDWVVLLSGQDYPLLPVEVIAERYRETRGDALVTAIPVFDNTTPGFEDLDPWPGYDPPWGRYEAVSRYYYRYTRLPRRHSIQGLHERLSRRVPNLEGRAFDSRHPHRAPRRLAVRSLRGDVYLGRRPRRSPFSRTFPCRAGHQWFSASGRAVREILRVVGKQPLIVDHYRRTLIPDESMFQSILGNSRNLIVLPDTTRLIVWESGAHPKTLTSADLPLITHSDAHLARKFDLAMDPMVLDALDLRAQER